ncbi:acyl carrier protein [Schinkia azotoformans]|uniref:acyl carrier protein n=1 Tax=Schinkia azotoformans TaxID=1454 RepID=UPI002DBEFCC1|nr:acyl carrier protein [Schinkia azotoformans]MEC1715547.1 acyl carrier protein [Schinkia azotoformans]MEC1743433.1 acyl carrier protein [Schinkia azotoformans]MEC1747973.1 acyl carrier protein [Schinkia azotoformans]MEC1758336.1 acyl carrier protein [Schinkia azotoformans]MEC1768375.1 acyl carrier protein [Schinkia azotoformans]
MNKNIKQKIDEILQEVFEIESVDESLLSRESNATWDSLKHLEIIMAIEEEFDIRFSAIEVTEVVNASDLYKIVEKKLYM